MPKGKHNKLRRTDLEDAHTIVDNNMWMKIHNNVDASATENCTTTVEALIWDNISECISSRTVVDAIRRAIARYYPYE